MGFAKFLLHRLANHSETMVQSLSQSHWVWNETWNPVKHKLRHWVIFFPFGFTFLDLSSLKLDMLLIMRIKQANILLLPCSVWACVGKWMDFYWYLRPVDPFSNICKQKAYSMCLSDFVWELSALFLQNRSPCAPLQLASSKPLGKVTLFLRPALFLRQTCRPRCPLSLV